MNIRKLSFVFAGFCLAASAVAAAGPHDRSPHDRPGHPGKQSHPTARHEGPRMGPNFYGRHHAPRALPPQAHRGHSHARPHRWQRGERLPAVYRAPRHVVKDWHRHGLKRPAKGYQWISVDRDFLLIATATGLIAQAVLSR